VAWRIEFLESKGINRRKFGSRAFESSGRLRTLDGHWKPLISGKLIPRCPLVAG
jgi:hypothetical protein